MKESVNAEIQRLVTFNCSQSNKKYIRKNFDNGAVVNSQNSFFIMIDARNSFITLL